MIATASLLHSFPKAIYLLSLPDQTGDPEQGRGMEGGEEGGGRWAGPWRSVRVTLIDPRTVWKIDWRMT